MAVRHRADGRRSDEICPASADLSLHRHRRDARAWPFHVIRVTLPKASIAACSAAYVLPAMHQPPHWMVLPPMVAGYLKSKFGDELLVRMTTLTVPRRRQCLWLRRRTTSADGGGGHDRGLTAATAHCAGGFDLRARRDFLRNGRSSNTRTTGCSHRDAARADVHPPDEQGAWCRSV